LNDCCVSNETDVEFKRLPEVKDKAYQFTMDVVEDLSLMVEAFGKVTAPNEMLTGSWKDLQTMRWDTPSCFEVVILIYLPGMSSMRYASGLTRRW
jgi:hypothetical protein